VSEPADYTPNHLAEAMAIIRGESSFLATAEHLKALAAQMESVLREKQLLTELLAAAMVDTGQSELYFPASDLERVRKNGINVSVVLSPPRAPQGSVLVQIARRPAPTGRPSKARLN
jgi:hypothetical protein